MLKNSSKILFLIILISGTLITVSSNSWLGSWMGLEINLLAFIPLMNNSKNLMSTESSLKYFLIQALASSILLFAIMMSVLKPNFMFQLNTFNFSEMIIISALMLKSGTAPFHFWFPSVMEGLSWMNSLVLMTWQKIAPLMLISYLIINYMIVCAAIMSVMIGSLGGFNQTSLRKLMAYSSISHIGWMLTSMISDETLWLFYFIMYSFLSSTIIIMFNLMKMFHFNQLFNSFFKSKTLKFSLFINLLSLGGLPPFLGFLPKWMVIQYLTTNGQLTLMILLTVLTLITLFFYLRMSFSAFMMNYYENNWYNNMYTNPSNMYLYTLLTFVSILGLPAVSLFYLF